MAIIPEFQAVVMAAGRGSRITEITSGCPKCLLPVGNMPLLWYPLMYLKNNGFQEVIVIIPESARSKLDAIKPSDLKLDIVTIPMGEDWGTADSLRHIKDKITSDIVVMSCDLLTDHPLHSLADLHRVNNASLTILLSDASLSLGSRDTPAPGQKGKHRQEKDIIGLEVESKRLILLNSEADFEDNLSIRMSILKKHPKIRITTNLFDAHLYIMNKSTMNYLLEHESVSTIKGEFLPSLLSKQFHSKKPSQVDSSSTTKKDETQSNKSGKNYSDLISELSSWTNGEKNLKEYMGLEDTRCYAQIMTEGFCIRVNTLSAYVEANRQIMKLRPAFISESLKVTTPTTPKSQIGSDCLMGDNTKLSEKVSVKRSVLGQNCSIGEKSKIINSILMDNVTVEDASTIQGSIICSNVLIGKSCDLKDCIVSKGKQVGDYAKVTNEVLLDMEEFMEI